MPPRVSVIVPVRDRRELLAELLDALAAQTFGDFEVVVVDDGSTDGSPAEAAGRTIGVGQPVVLNAGGVGAVNARILGVSVAGGEILAFTDSDCRPGARWLERGVAAVDLGADLVCGLTRPPRPLQPLERSVSSGNEGLYPTCNLFVRHDAYLRAGGFDRRAAERLGFRWSGRARGLGFGEDTILAWTLIRSGGVAAFEPEARVEHHIFPASWSELIGRAVQGGAFPALIREVPELRATLLADRVLLGRRRLPFYATAVSVALGRRRAATLALAWWFAARATGVRTAAVSPARKVQFVVAEMSSDAVLGTALVVGSAQARTLVL